MFLHKGTTSLRFIFTMFDAIFDFRIKLGDLLTDEATHVDVFHIVEEATTNPLPFNDTTKSSVIKRPCG